MTAKTIWVLARTCDEETHRFICAWDGKPEVGEILLQEDDAELKPSNALALYLKGECTTEFGAYYQLFSYTLL